MPIIGPSMLASDFSKLADEAKAVLAAEFNKLVSTGIPGELSLPKLQTWNVEYERAKLNLDPAVSAAISDETELQSASS